MKIHGLHIYPQSVDVIPGERAPILVHGRLSEERSDFFYVFQPLAVALRDHVVVHDFAISYTELGVREDPIPTLRDRFGASLLDVDVASQLMLLRGDDFESWAETVYFAGGAFLPIFRETPPFGALKRMFWGRFRLTSDTWPSYMRAVLHMWDDIYWQLFTTERSDLDVLIQAHRGDAQLKMYFVDLDLEYPEPSGQMLQSATSADES
jgi:hypothetical protein